MAAVEMEVEIARYSCYSLGFGSCSRSPACPSNLNETVLDQRAGMDVEFTASEKGGKEKVQL
eukprot:2608920-Rhodomonas_salina.2